MFLLYRFKTVSETDQQKSLEVENRKSPVNRRSPSPKPRSPIHKSRTPTRKSPAKPVSDYFKMMKSKFTKFACKNSQLILEFQALSHEKLEGTSLKFKINWTICEWKSSELRFIIPMYQNTTNTAVFNEIWKKPVEKENYFYLPINFWFLLRLS